MELTIVTGFGATSRHEHLGAALGAFPRPRERAFGAPTSTALDLTPDPLG